MPPAQKPTGAEGAARALPREQPVTAAAVTPTPVNNESAGTEGAEFIDQDPPRNDDLLLLASRTNLLASGNTLGGAARFFPPAQPCFGTFGGVFVR